MSKNSINLKWKITIKKLEKIYEVYFKIRIRGLMALADIEDIYIYNGPQYRMLGFVSFDGR